MHCYIVKQIAPEVFIVSWDWNVPKLICNIVFLSQIFTSLEGQDSFDFTVVWRENYIWEKKKTNFVQFFSGKKSGFVLFYFDCHIKYVALCNVFSTKRLSMFVLVLFLYPCVLLVFIIIKFKISTPKKLNQYVSGGLYGEEKRNSNNINQLQGKLTGEHIVKISGSMCSMANEALLSNNKLLRILKSIPMALYPFLVSSDVSSWQDGWWWLDSACPVCSEVLSYRSSSFH